MKLVGKLIRTLQYVKQVIEPHNEQAFVGEMTQQVDEAVAAGQKLLHVFEHHDLHAVLLGSAALLEHMQGHQETSLERNAALRAQQLRMLIKELQTDVRLKQGELERCR